MICFDIPDGGTRAKWSFLIIQNLPRGICLCGAAPLIAPGFGIFPKDHRFRRGRPDESSWVIVRDIPARRRFDGHGKQRAPDALSYRFRIDPFLSRYLAIVVNGIA